MNLVTPCIAKTIYNNDDDDDDSEGSTYNDTNNLLKSTEKNTIPSISFPPTSSVLCLFLRFFLGGATGTLGTLGTLETWPAGYWRGP